MCAHHSLEQIHHQSMFNQYCPGSRLLILSGTQPGQLHCRATINNCLLTWNPKTIKKMKKKKHVVIPDWLVNRQSWKGFGLFWSPLSWVVGWQNPQCKGNDQGFCIAHMPNLHLHQPKSTTRFLAEPTQTFNFFYYCNHSDWRRNSSIKWHATLASHIFSKCLSTIQIPPTLQEILGAQISCSTAPVAAIF